MLKKVNKPGAKAFIKKFGSHIEEICKKYRIKRLYLFGSAVDSIKKANDYDLAVSGFSGRKFFEFYSNLDSPFDKECDLLDYDYYKKMDNALYEFIDRDGVVIYER